MSHLMNTYKRLPVAFERGAGCWLWDKQGNRYLDALAGIAVCGVGHSHPRLVEAITAQAGKLIHTSNVYQIENQEKLGDRLAAISGMDEVFFCNSGCEANEAAIKIARLYGHQKAIEMPAIIVMDKAFHGRTIATLSATGNRKVQAGFEPLVPGFVRVPFNDLAAVRKVAQSNRNVVAVLLEVIQGEGGINICDADYLQGLREICDGERLAADARRGAMRHGPHRQVVCAPAFRREARRHAARQGPGLGRADRRASARPRSRRVQAGQPRHDVRRQPAGVRGGVETLDIIEEERLLTNAAALGDHIAARFRATSQASPACAISAARDS